MRRLTLGLLAIGALELLLKVAPLGAEIHVLPVVVTGVGGKAGSYWDTEVRIISIVSGGPVTVRRAWVALEGGGFADTPGSAPVWTLPPVGVAGQEMRMLLLSGGDLLRGANADRGAVGLEVDGAVVILSRTANTERQPRLPNLGGGRECCLPGNAQLVPALHAPLQGQGLIGWVTSGDDYFRTNVGLINPSETAIRVQVSAVVMDSAFYPGDGPSILWKDADIPQPIVVDVPAWGYRQVNDIFPRMPINGCPVECPPYVSWVAPAVVTVRSDQLRPFFAYASVLFTPRNDPDFVVAEPLALLEAEP